MGKIIAVASGKGGTGKTTFTANVALALAHMGQRVLCLDCDITLRNLDLALGLSDRALMDFSDVLEGRCTLHEAAVPHERYPSLSLLTAPMADRPLSLSVPKLQALAREIRESYDWCLIDAPAGLGQGFQMAACMADQVIVITTTDVSAMRDAQRTAAELSAFPSGTVHLVVGRVSKKVLRQLHTTIDDAIDAAGLPLLGVKGDALHALQLVDLRGQVGRHRIRHGVDHLPQAARDLAFGAIGRGQIERDDVLIVVARQNLRGDFVRENQTVDGAFD